MKFNQMYHSCVHAMCFARYAEKEAKKNTNLSLSSACWLMITTWEGQENVCMPTAAKTGRAKTRAEVSALWGDRLLLRGYTELLRGGGQETSCQLSQLESSGCGPLSPEVQRAAVKTKLAQVGGGLLRLHKESVGCLSIGKTVKAFGKLHTYTSPWVERLRIGKKRVQAKRPHKRLGHRYKRGKGNRKEVTKCYDRP